jgi:hypothetical protein
MINFKVGEVVGFVQNGQPTMFLVVNIMPSACAEGPRYYGHNINGKAVACHREQLYSPPKADMEIWEQGYKP